MNQLKRTIWLLLAVILSFQVTAKVKDKDLACQAWTFKQFPLEEALQKMQALGLKYIEMYPKQQMSKTDTRTTSFDMSDAQLADLKKMLKHYQVKAISYGVVSPRKLSDWEVLFRFAKRLGVQTIVSEPNEDLFPEIDRLCRQFHIRVAIHNHAVPTRYADPVKVKKLLKDRSKYMGVCADIGHWTRSGFQAADCLNLLEGRIFEIHAKDVDGTTRKAHPVVFGEGVLDWKAVFAELKRQRFKGKFVIEHETSWENPVPDLKKNIAFLKSFN